MAVAFRHRSRKLFGDNETSSNIPIDCKEYCESRPGLFYSGYCPLRCCNACPTICFYQSDYPNPTPSPPPPPFVLMLPPLPPSVVNSFPVPPPKQNSQHLSPALAIVLPVFFSSVLLSCCLRVMSLRRGSRREAAAAAQPQQPPQEQEREDEIYSGLMVDHPIWYIRTDGLHSSVINAIAVCKYKEVEGVVGRAECSVCLNGFQEDDPLRMLPKCQHAFHLSCIDTWLKSHKNCPVCRAVIELVDIKFPGAPGVPRHGEIRMETPEDDHRE